MVRVRLGVPDDGETSVSQSYAVECDYIIDRCDLVGGVACQDVIDGESANETDVVGLESHVAIHVVDVVSGGYPEGSTEIAETFNDFHVVDKVERVAGTWRGNQREGVKAQGVGIDKFERDCSGVVKVTDSETVFTGGEVKVVVVHYSESVVAGADKSGVTFD